MDPMTLLASSPGDVYYMEVYYNLNSQKIIDKITILG